MLIHLIAAYERMCGRTPTPLELWRVIVRAIEDSPGTVFADYKATEEELRSKGASPEFVTNIQELVTEGSVMRESRNGLALTPRGRADVDDNLLRELVKVIQHYTEAA